jgi:hypothetical protein
MKTPAAIAACVLLLGTGSAQAHLVNTMHRADSRAQLHAAAYHDYRHALYVCVRGWGSPKREHCRALRWLRHVLAVTEPSPTVSWEARQIAAAEMIARESGGDPWPNCPDPYDGGGTWQVTVNCENGGSWYDTPGAYRCGLQFDPMWERRFGPLCPR